MSIKTVERKKDGQGAVCSCNLTKKREISMNISPRVYILHEEA